MQNLKEWYIWKYLQDRDRVRHSKNKEQTKKKAYGYQGGKGGRGIN